MRKNDSRNTSPRCNKIVAFLCLLFASAFFILFIHENYPQRILNRLKNNNAENATVDKTLIAWKTCLDQLKVKADIVFFGDSITRQSDFSAFFTDKTICNLGLGSDTIAGMQSRISMINDVSPDIIFVMGGINSLKDSTLEKSVHEYEILLSDISDKCNGKLFVVSTLPISHSASKDAKCSPETIRSFNASIQSFAEESSITFIDLHSHLSSADGFILPEMTTDGVHLTESAYTIWYGMISEYIN